MKLIIVEVIVIEVERYLDLRVEFYSFDFGFVI